jgi:hypothetical protein
MKPGATIPKFAPVAPSGRQIDQQNLIAAKATEFAHTLAENCPPGEALDTALQSLQNSVLWANQGIVYAGEAAGAR